jgi:hypothetical protein
MTGGAVVTESERTLSLTGTDFYVENLDAEFAAVFHAVVAGVYDVRRVYRDDVFGGA